MKPRISEMNAKERQRYMMAHNVIMYIENAMMFHHRKRLIDLLQDYEKYVSRKRIPLKVLPTIKALIDKHPWLTLKIIDGAEYVVSMRRW